MEYFALKFEELSNQQVYEILKSRSEVFMLGQGIICQDMDDKDYESLHCFYMEDRRVVAYLRAFRDSDGAVLVGRVLALNKGIGIGSALMKDAVDSIRLGMPTTTIRAHAQLRAAGFYDKLGFSRVSDEYLEEGVPHVTMELEI